MSEIAKEILGQFLAQQSRSIEQRRYADEIKTAAVTTQLEDCATELTVHLELQKQEKENMTQHLEELKRAIHEVEDKIDAMAQCEREMEARVLKQREAILDSYESTQHELLLRRQEDDLENAACVLRQLKHVLCDEIPPPPPKRRLHSLDYEAQDLTSAEFEEAMDGFFDVV